MHFSRIALDIIQFPPVDIIIEMYQFISFRTNSIMTFYHMLGRIFIEVIIQRFPPIFRMFSFQQRQQRYSLNIIRYRRTCQFKESRRIIDILNHLGDVAFTIETFRQTHNQRGTHRFFIHKAFIEPAMFTHIKSLI